MGEWACVFVVVLLCLFVSSLILKIQGESLYALLSKDCVHAPVPKNINVFFPFLNGCVYAAYKSEHNNEVLLKSYFDSIISSLRM